jgi:hypothetical protein
MMLATIRPYQVRFAYDKRSSLSCQGINNKKILLLSIIIFLISKRVSQWKTL